MDDSAKNNTPSMFNSDVMDEFVELDTSSTLYENMSQEITPSRPGATSLSPRVGSPQSSSPTESPALTSPRAQPSTTESQRAGPPLAPTSTLGSPRAGPSTPSTANQSAGPCLPSTPTTVHQQPDWLKVLLQTFEAEIITPCSQRARTAAENNEYIKVGCLKCNFCIDSRTDNYRSDFLSSVIFQIWTHLVTIMFRMNEIIRQSRTSLSTWL